MKVAFIARSSLYTAKGGDTVQMVETARYLKKLLNINVDIRLTNEKINYGQYDLIHFFSLVRPADILPHISKSAIPFAVTPLLIDYSEYDKKHRKGIPGLLFRVLSAGQIEYIKTIGRWAKQQQKSISFSYLLRGHRKSIRYIIKRANVFLPNSEMEYRQMVKLYSLTPPYAVIPNGINKDLFESKEESKDKNMVVCAARIEGLKNQLNLIKALNNSEYKLFIIGNAAPNQISYYEECKALAANNIQFIDHLPQEELIQYYKKAKVHILPSWFETCGLSTLEAAAMGCSVVITEKGYASEYCNGHAFYCDPSSPSSILEATNKASNANGEKLLKEKILKDYTWANAALKTYTAYKKILSEK